MTLQSTIVFTYLQRQELNPAYSMALTILLSKTYRQHSPSANYITSTNTNDEIYVLRLACTTAQLMTVPPCHLLFGGYFASCVRNLLNATSVPTATTNAFTDPNNALFRITNASYYV